MFKRLMLLWPACIGAAYLWSALVGAPDSPAEGPAAAASASEGADEHQSFAAVRAEPRPLSAREMLVKAELEYEMRANTEFERVVMLDGRELEGRILDRSADGVRLLRSFGDSGEMEVMLRRHEIARVDRVSSDPPSISDRDVRFRMEFPDFNLYRRPPFTIMTNQRFLEVEGAVGILEELNADVVRAMHPLVGESERQDGIQILFFSDEAKFSEYRDSFAPNLGYASGFFSPLKNRLVIFDQSRSDWVQSASSQIENTMEKVARPALRMRRGAGLHDSYMEARRNLQKAASRENRVIVRHEGAHQLLHAYGVHSERGAEHLWLIEGMASYFESPPGSGNPGRAEELKRAGKLLSYEELVNYSSLAGLGGLGGNLREVSLAYAQSWLIVDYLMREKPDALFEYIRFVSDPANDVELESRPRFEILTRFAGSSLEQELAQARRRL